MCFILTFISIMMLLNSGVLTQVKTIKDLSDRCKNGRVIFIYLTSGLGDSDASVSMIATNETLNCSLQYFVKPGVYIMVVVEFPDTRPNEYVCTYEQNYVLMVSGVRETNVCAVLNRSRSAVYCEAGESKLTVRVGSVKDMNTIKLTATSMRDPKDLKCIINREDECIYNNKVYCMTAKVSCDGNINCGVQMMFDEDKKKCEEPKLTPTVIILSILMGIVSFWLIISITINLLPKRRETFVYKFDQSKSLFDSEGEQSSLDIHIQVMFPTEKSKKAFGGKKEL